MTDEKWDKKLKIKTSGGTNHAADGENFPYEPTPYRVLLRLAKSGLLTEKNTLLDYGCGKGRVAFLLSRLTGCRVIGIDYNEDLIRAANENLVSSGMKNIIFLQCKAEDYEIEEADTFFFFNPFSETVLKKVMDQVLWSWYENPRLMRLMFYYPTDEDVAILTATDGLMFSDEIDCSDLFDGGGKRERILIFETVPEATMEVTRPLKADTVILADDLIYIEK